MGSRLTQQNTQSHLTPQSMHCNVCNRIAKFRSQPTSLICQTPARGQAHTPLATFHRAQSRLPAHITQIMRHKPRYSKRRLQATIVEADHRGSAPPMLRHMLVCSMTYPMHNPQDCLRDHSPGIPAHKPHSANRHPHTQAFPPHSTHPDSPKLPTIYRPIPPALQRVPRVTFPRSKIQDSGV